MWTRIIVIGFLAFIVFNLGAALFHMLRDRGTSDRTLNALAWRIGLSVTLFLLLILGMATGIIEPHGIGVPSTNP